jgi:DNA-binding HxlR family transcriptional regulator
MVFPDAHPRIQQLAIHWSARSDREPNRESTHRLVRSRAASRGQEAWAMTKKLPKSFNCPTEFTLAVLDGKWKTVILCYLKERPRRYTELRKLVPKLSDKVLTERLHDLIASGLVARNRRTGAAQEYMLTQKGRLLSGVLHHLYAWGLENAASFDVHVGQPLKVIEETRKAG